MNNPVGNKLSVIAEFQKKFRCDTLGQHRDFLILKWLEK